MIGDWGLGTGDEGDEGDERDKGDKGDKEEIINDKCQMPNEKCQMTNNKIFFEFEADFVSSLRCIPMQVRYKLDTCGIKLKLSDWNQMSQAEREALVELPCNTAAEIQSYSQYLEQLILNRTGTPPAQLAIEPNPAWMDSTNLPASVQEQAQELGITLTTPQWESLTPLKRFALIKLSRSGHENSNFPKAMAEFHLL